MWRLNRRLSAAPDSLKYLTAFALIGIVGFADFIVGEEISFSVFYLLPIAYGAWFISREAGFTGAIVSAIIWFSVEVSQHPPFSHQWIPIWNACVRLGFFVLGVGLVRLMRNSEIRLVREVARRTRTLRAEAKRRRKLERELLEVTAREHVRLAQDLHDGLGQYLSALSFHARMLSDDLRHLQSPQAAQAERIVALIRTTNQTIRRLDRAIRVPDSNSGGLAESLRSLAAHFEQLTGLRCDLQLAEIPLAFDEFRALMLFRIVQEAVNNAVKHAKPRIIAISTRIEDAVLTARVSNDGSDFAEASTPRPGAGLRIMRLRAELIGATLAIHANANGGCTVECVMPLAQPFQRSNERSR